MLNLAGFNESNREKWAGDPLYQRIKKSRAGLDCLERILQSYKWLIGYNGDSVHAQDKEKLLLWWYVALDSQGDQYRIFFGDLRTKIVSRDKLIQLDPAPAALIE
jgi:hypothetical protein